MVKLARKQEGDKRTVKPPAPRAKPAAAANKPAVATSKSAAPANKPAVSTNKPAAPTNKPAAAIDKPAAPTTKPAAAPKRNVARAPAAAPAESSGEINLGYLADFVGFHLRLAQDASYRVFSRHREKDLVKPGRFPALAIIQLNPGISQSALGRAIARDKSTVSPLIKDLQRNGFISRKPSAHDRRSVTLTLTKKGERTLTRLHAHAAAHEDELDRLIGSSKTRFVTLLDKIVSGMGAHD